MNQSMLSNLNSQMDVSCGDRTPSSYLFSLSTDGVLNGRGHPLAVLPKWETDNISLLKLFQQK